MENGNYTRQEISSQPEAWEAALKVLDDNRLEILGLQPNRQYPTILFTGCGSTYYLSLSAAAICQQLTGLTCRAFPASELWLYPRSSFTNDRVMLVAISRSGETTETLKTCQAFQNEKRGTLLTLSCYEKKPLTGLGDINIVLPSGQEQSVAQTRAFSTLFLAALGSALLWSGRYDLYAALSLLPEACRNVLDRAAPLAVEIGSDSTLERFYWLGSGPRYGLAAELSLKMKEMSLSHSEPFHFLEFRHGPKSMITSSSMVIGLQSTLKTKHEAAVLQDVHSLGGKVISLADKNGTFLINSGLDEAIRDVLYLPVGQLIAFERSLAKGLNPDLPNNLDTVVILQGGEQD